MDNDNDDDREGMDTYVFNSGTETLLAPQTEADDGKSSKGTQIGTGTEIWTGIRMETGVGTRVWSKSIDEVDGNEDLVIDRVDKLRSDYIGCHRHTDVTHSHVTHTDVTHSHAMYPH